MFVTKKLPNRIIPLLTHLSVRKLHVYRGDCENWKYLSVKTRPKKMYPLNLQFFSHASSVLLNLRLK